LASNPVGRASFDEDKLEVEPRAVAVTAPPLPLPVLYAWF
jgi:hypothetical protein